MAPYAKGDIVVRSVPFAGGPNVDEPRNLQKFCYTCCRPTMSKMITEEECKMRTCTACKRIHYCSTECQKRDWKAVHRIECGYLIQAQRNRKFGTDGHFWLDSEIRIFARVLFRLGRAAAAAADDDDEEKALVARFLKLDSHVDDDRRGVEPSTIDTLRQYLVGHEYTRSLTDRYLAEIISRTQYHMRSNLGSIGEDVALVCVEIAEMGHSCASNASMVLREDGCVYVIANRAIESDAEVRVSVVNNLMPGGMRRRALKDEFYIDCKCDMCKSDDGKSSSGSPLRDDYLRSIRCSSAFGNKKSFAACTAPIPFGKNRKIVNDTCANGHKQTYTNEQLLTYSSALMDYDETMNSANMCRAMGCPISHKIEDDMCDEWPLLETYYHPMNAHAFVLEVLKEASDANLRYRSSEDQTVAEWARSTFASIFDKSATGLVANFERFIECDGYHLFDCLLHCIMKADWGTTDAGKSPIKRATHRAIIELLAELVPLAERYLGVNARRTAAIRRVSEMDPKELAKMGKVFTRKYTNWKWNLDM